MTIRKSTLFIGKYVAHQKLQDGRYITGVGRTHYEAINDCMMMLGWVEPKFQVNKYPDAFISEEEQATK